MDKLERYRDAILALLDRYSEFRPSNKDIGVYKVIDRVGHHYQIMHEGWSNKHRYYGAVLHFDIKDGKIWIQHNGTENDIAAELMELGVAKDDIVLAFHAPQLRKYTGFAVS